MKTACLIVLISIASCVCVSCYPSKPLNERSTDFAWQAWLLVDQSRQGEIGLLRRRITPKSVFIAPTFSTESLPPCAEGYKSDAMGRCIKVIRINESNHFNFVLDRLNAQFPDYEEETERTVTQGPFQLGIPLTGSNEDGEIAILMTPSTNNFDPTTVKIDVKRHDGDDVFNVENVAAILGLKPEEVKMTTFGALTTISPESTTTTIDTTTMDTSTIETTLLTDTPETTTSLSDPQETTTVVMTVAEETTTTIPTTTNESPTDEPEALFFQLRN